MSPSRIEHSLRYQHLGRTFALTALVLGCLYSCFHMRLLALLPLSLCVFAVTHPITWCIFVVRARNSCPPAGTFSPASKKVHGVRYVISSEGVELPLLDLRHPAFAPCDPQVSEYSLEKTITLIRDPLTQFVKTWAPGFAIRFLVRRSILARALFSSYLSKSERESGRFVSGLATYMMKCGPAMLGDGRPICRHLAKNILAVETRIRMDAFVALIRQSLLGGSVKNSVPLHFVVIAGGTCITLLNLLVLMAEDPDERHVLLDRQIVISNLDLDETGPKFAQTCLAILMEKELQGLEISLLHTRVNWSDVESIQKAVQKDCPSSDAYRIASSEGGIFSYGSVEDIRRILEKLALVNIRVFVAGCGVNNRRFRDEIQSFHMSIKLRFHSKEDIVGYLEGTDWVWQNSIHHIGFGQCFALKRG